MKKILAALIAVCSVVTGALCYAPVPPKVWFGDGLPHSATYKMVMLGGGYEVDPNVGATIVVSKRVNDQGQWTELGNATTTPGGQWYYNLNGTSDASVRYKADITYAGNNPGTATSSLISTSQSINTGYSGAVFKAVAGTSGGAAWFSAEADGITGTSVQYRENGSSGDWTNATILYSEGVYDGSQYKYRALMGYAFGLAEGYYDFALVTTAGTVVEYCVYVY